MAAAGPDLTAAGGQRGLRPASRSPHRVDLAEGVLRAMSLDDGFAPIVLLIGHGSSTVNNPYGTGLALRRLRWPHR